MFLIILGVIVFIAAGILVKNNAALAKFKGVGRLVALLLIILGITTACVK